MLAPRTSSAFVCIRCELQLARRRLPPYSRQIQCVNFSTTARRHDGLEEVKAQVDPPKSELSIKKEKLPLDRIRRRKGRIIRETSARLRGMKRLGDEADILVLKELEQARPQEPEPVEPTEVLEVPDILASLQQESKELTPEEVIERLDSLRPKTDGDLGDPTYISQSTFIRRRNQLVFGFTHQQLTLYYSAAKNIKQEKVSKDILDSLKDDAVRGKAVVPRTQWQPGVTSLKIRSPQFVPHSQTKTGSVRKQLIVDRILRDVWGLVPQEELAAMGEIELSLKGWQLSLLSAGEKEPVLARIGRERRVKFEVDHTQHVLRITADKTTAEYAAKDIEDALATATSTKLSLKPWLPYLNEAKIPLDNRLATLFTQEDFNMVNSVTHASVQRMDNANTLVIRGLTADDVDEAETMLIRMLPHKSNFLPTIDTTNLDKGRNAASLLPVFNDERSLEYKHRNISLGRWSLPVTRRIATNASDGDDQLRLTSEGEGQSLLDVHDSNQLVKTMLDAFRQAQCGISVPKTLPRKTAEMYHEPAFRLSATFGQALFPCAQLGEVGHDSTSIFQPTVPSLPNLLHNCNLQNLTQISSPTLIYDFIASPDKNSIISGTPLPALRTRIRTNPTTGAVEIYKVTLLIHKHEHTILLPSYATDIQFSTIAHLQLRKDRYPQSLTDWLDAVSKNIASNDRLSAPSLTLDIPRWTIPGSPAKAAGLVPATYRFSSIKFMQTVSGEYAGDPLLYTAQQAGKMGARMGALALVRAQNAKSLGVLLHDKPQFEGFVRKAFGLVGRITEAAGTGQSLAKLLKPRSDTGTRRAKRLLNESTVNRTEGVEEREGEKIETSV